MCACSTTRTGGVSQPPFDGFNLGIRTTDTRDNVLKNRQMPAGKNAPARTPLLALASTRYTGGGCGISACDETADALWTQRPGVVCAIMSADCLPVLFADKAGGCVGAAHAGWRGLLGGVLEATIDALPIPPTQLCTWLGPSIGPQAFAVGDDVYDAFCTQNQAYSVHFKATQTPGKWLADLPGLARQRLQ